MCWFPRSLLISLIGLFNKSLGATLWGTADRHWRWEREPSSRVRKPDGVLVVGVYPSKTGGLLSRWAWAIHKGHCKLKQGPQGGLVRERALGEAWGKGPWREVPKPGRCHSFYSTICTSASFLLASTWSTSFCFCWFGDVFCRILTCSPFFVFNLFCFLVVRDFLFVFGKSKIYSSLPFLLCSVYTSVTF